MAQSQTPAHSSVSSAAAQSSGAPGLSASSSAKTSATPNTELAVSSTGERYTGSATRVTISKSHIVVEGAENEHVPLPPPERWADGVDAELKQRGPNDLYIVPLGAALRRVRGGKETTLLLAVDRSVPYRLVIETLFTAGQEEYGLFALAVRGPTGEEVIISKPPKMHTRPPAEREKKPLTPTLSLSLFLVREGVVVKASGGSVAPGCEGIGPGITVARAPGQIDGETLGRCLDKVRAVSPLYADEHAGTLVANKDISFAEVIATLDILRKKRFEDIAFGVPR